MYTYTYIYIYIHIHTYTYTYMYICTYISIHIYVCIHAYIHVCIHPRRAQGPCRRVHPHPSSSPLLLSLELSDAQVYEPEMRALLGTAANFCEVLVLKSPNVMPTLETLTRGWILQAANTTQVPNDHTSNSEATIQHFHCPRKLANVKKNQPQQQIMT